MTIHVHTPTADYGLSTACLSSGQTDAGTGTTIFFAAAAANYNMYGEDIGAGGRAAADCFTGPVYIAVDTSVGVTNLLLNCQAGLAAHAGRAQVVCITQMGGANAITVQDSGGNPIGPGTSATLGNTETGVFIFNGTAWVGLNGN
jgi:hypothetical protein